MFKIETKYNMTSFSCFYGWFWPESVFLLLTLNKHFSIGCEGQVLILWKLKKRHNCFLIKVARFISFSDLLLHRTAINYEQMTKLWTYYRAVGSIFLWWGGRGRGEAEQKFRPTWFTGKKKNKLSKTL